MFDSYKHFLETPGYNKIIGDDYLIVEFKCPIKEELFAAWSECHSIVYVLQGQKKWITPANEYLVKANQCIFLRKGAFKNQQFFEERFCVLMFFMKDDFIRRSVEEDIKRESLTLKRIEHPEIVYRINVSDSLQTLYHSFFSYLKQPNKIPKKIIELKFREMLLNICLDPYNTDVGNVLYTLAQKLEGTIGSVMEEQYMYNLKIEEYARLCGKSVSSFKREFASLYHTTPGKWLLARRLKLGSEYLLNTDLPVQQICYECGFESDSHFNRSFKSLFNQTPKQWRDARVKAITETP